MTIRQESEQILRDAYEARQRGDRDVLSRMFSPHAEFRMDTALVARMVRH